MDYLHTIILSIIQGIVEFLPISSSGHLMLFEHLLKIDSPQLLFELILNLGTLIALICFFFKEFISILDIRKKENLFLIGYIIIATVMTVIIGLILQSVLKDNRSLITLGVGFLITAGILYSTKKIKEKNDSLNAKKSLIIGIFQGFSAFPGISRSGITVSIARHLGLEHKKAFLFSFMLAVPVGLGALFLELIKLSSHSLAQQELMSLSLTHYMIGLLVSFLFGLCSIKLFYKLYLSRYFYRFAYYCLIIGVITIILGVNGL